MLGTVISYRLIEGHWCPFFVCAACGENVTEDGNVDHLINVETGDTVVGPLVSHKQCSDAVRAKHGGDYPEGRMWLWDELTHFLWFLVENSKVDMADAEVGGRFIDSL